MLKIEPSDPVIFFHDGAVAPKWTKDGIEWPTTILRLALVVADLHFFLNFNDLSCEEAMVG